MTLDEALAVVSRHFTDELVVGGAGTSYHAWNRQVGPERDDSYHIHCMGMASSFGLGLALVLPKVPVWVFDGDGGLVMNLGSLLTMASKQPANLTYFLVSNRQYGTIEGPGIVNAKRTDPRALAKAAGIERAYSFGAHADLEREIGGILGARAFSFVVLEVESDEVSRPKVGYEGPEIKYRFARHVEKRAGVRVLGPAGY